MGEDSVSIKIWQLYVPILPGACPSLLWLHFILMKTKRSPPV